MTPEAEVSSVVDAAAVRRLYEDLMEGWNRGSGDSFAATFAEDGDLVGFDGNHLKGRRQIASFHQPLFSTWLKGTRLVGKVDSVRFLTPEVALVHAVGGTVMRGRSQSSPERDSIQTLVATREDGEWRFAGFQNTRVRLMTRNARSTLLWLFSDWLWRLFRANR